jgi:prepilin-type N-terminal cleavage/methylation domain-containing protein
MRIRARRTRGFTLIELMIAVAIIGVLATTAIAGFRGYQLRTKRSEAMSNLASIRTAQNSYYPEANTFVDAPPSPAVAALGPNQQNWVPTGAFSSVPGIGFDVLGWQPEGAVYFDYDTVIGPGGTSYTAAAYGDTDGDGFVSVFLYVMPDGAGGTVPSGLGGFPPPWDRNSCQPLLNVVAQVPSVDGCGFPTADDY